MNSELSPIRQISPSNATELRDGWNLYLTPPGALDSPAGLAAFAPVAIPAIVPGTVAAAIRAAKSDALQGKSPDDWDVWYCGSFDAEPAVQDELVSLVFDGLATLADIWLNGEPILHSESMFLSHSVDVTGRLASRNDLCIRFASLNRALETRRPRPRWRTHLVDHQNLRWFRTTLLGRMPGWHHRPQEIHALGPWRPVTLKTGKVDLVRASVRSEHDGRDGIVKVAAGIVLPESAPEVEVFVRSGEHSARLNHASHAAAGCLDLEGELIVPGAELWWPHTHGAQPLYPLELAVRFEDGAETVFDLGRTGFRSIVLDQSDGNFAFSINGEAVFLRGACWSTADSFRLTAKPEAIDSALGLLRDAGANVLRMPGTGFPESNYFYERCAELGIAVWQDFPFGLMDYPSGDPAFASTVTEEARQLLVRLSANPSLVLLCGNSECEATAALHGLSAEQWNNPLFTELLAAEAAHYCPDVPYVPSSQWGGDLPFHPNSGVAYDYGVGAYLRPLEDARRSGVRFASECLGFANIPEDSAIDTFLAPGETPGSHPSWKASVPRDCSLGWDFDNVRDHYVETIFGEDTRRLLYSDTERYLALGRAVVPEIMEAVLGEWRHPGSRCNGAIVLMSQDLWPGAGWGLLDSGGHPKSAYYGLKRACQPLLLAFSDEGLSGLRLHVVNETAQPVTARLRLALYRHGQTKVHESLVPIAIGRRDSISLGVDGIIGHFLDSAYAYRFGPPVQDVTVAALESPETGETLARAFHFPAERRFAQLPDLGLSAVARPIGETGDYELTLRAERFVQCVNIVARGWLPDDNYFHIEPGQNHKVRLYPFGKPRPLSGQVASLNGNYRTQIGIATDECPANVAVY